MMGSRTEPVVLESGEDALQGGRLGQGPASADEAGAVGFAGDLALLAALAHHEIQEPRRLFPFGAGAAGAKHGGARAHELGLHEQIAEGGMGRVRRRGRQHNLGVTGQFDDAPRRANGW